MAEIVVGKIWYEQKNRDGRVYEILNKHAGTCNFWET